MPRYFPVIGSKIPVNDAREFSSERPINTGLHQPAPDKKGLNSRICPVNSRKLRGDRFVYDCTHHAFSNSSSSPRQSLQEKKADLDPPSLHRKIPFLTRDFRDRFDDWVVGHQFEPDYLRHPVSANHTFPGRRQIGRFCGDFRPLTSRVLVSVGAHPLRRRFLARCLCINKFRSRRPWLSARSERS